MAMMSNIGNLFADARTRTIILLTFVLIIVGVSVGYFALRGVAGGADSKAQVTNVPGGIESIPGSVNPTVQYAQLQQQQNVEQAEAAKRRGKSAIPTIIRTETIAPGQQVPLEGTGGVGFRALSRSQDGAQKSLWLESLMQSKCDAATIKRIQAEGADASVFKEAGCDARALEAAGFSLAQLRQAGYTSEALRAAGYTAAQLRAAGYNASELRRAGFSACDLKAAGYTAKELLDAGYSPEELRGAGFSPAEIQQAMGGTLKPDDIRRSGCSREALQRLRAAGVKSETIRRVSGCRPNALKAAGFTNEELLTAGFTPAEISPNPANCNVTALRQARARGVSAAEIRRTSGCDAAQLRAAGYTAAELKDAGYTAKELRDAGFNAGELRDAGYSPNELKDAGFTARQLRDAGFTPQDLKAAGFTAAELKAANVPDEELRQLGYTDRELQQAGVPAQAPVVTAPATTVVSPIIARPTTGRREDAALIASNKQLQQLANRQAQAMSEQQYTQELQARQNAMNAQANKLLADWQSPAQVLVQGNLKDDVVVASTTTMANGTVVATTSDGVTAVGPAVIPTLVKAGDVLYAVLDTSINSDEPSPVLATIVAGRFRGAKLLGSITRPDNATKVVLTFNVLSLRDVDKTIPINAVAIDPNTARTALASKVDTHFLLRYGSMFAAAFMQGLGSAYASQGTTVSAGGSDVANVVTVTTPERPFKDNAIIGLSQVGQQWGNAIAGNFNRPPTVKVFAGSSLGILFTQDVIRPAA